MSEPYRWKEYQGAIDAERVIDDLENEITFAEKLFKICFENISELEWSTWNSSIKS